MRGLGGVILLAACGRVGFAPVGDAVGDAAPSGDSVDALLPIDLPCNTAINAGSFPSITATLPGSRWFATAPTPDGVVVVGSTTNGLEAATIDLRAMPPVRGPMVTVMPMVSSEVQVTVSQDRVFFTSAGISGAGTEIVVRDLALGPISSHLESAFSVTGPDNAAPSPGGGIAAVGTRSNFATAALIDRNGAVAASAQYPLTGATGGSMVALSGGGYAAVWYTSVEACEIRTLDATLAQVAIATPQTAPDCGVVRVAASTTDHIATSWSVGGRLDGRTYDRALTSVSAVTVLSTPYFEPPRMAGGAGATWMIAPTSGTDLFVVRADDQGLVSAPLRLAPFNSPGNAYIYDVVRHGDRAYAVWLSKLASPDIYVMQLCP